MNADRLLLIYSGWLGDLVWILPCLHGLRRSFRSVSLVVSEVQSPLAGMLKGGLVDEVFIDQASRRLITARRIRQAARAGQVGTFVDLKGSAKTGLYIPWRARARVFLPHRRDAREPWPARLLHPFADSLPRRPDGHRVEAYLSAVKRFHSEPFAVSFAVPFDGATVEAGERIIARESLRDTPSVALNLGSAQHSKIWPADRFRRLAELLERDLGCKAVIMGARSFAANGNYDVRASRQAFGGSTFTNLVEETDFAVDAYLLRCGVFKLSVGCDSYAGHMAGSAEEVQADVEGAARSGDGRWFRAQPTVSLFGPTHPAFCRPYDPTGVFNTVVAPEEYPGDCVYDRSSHTCPHYGDRHCRGASHCMRKLTVARVAAAVEAQLRAVRCREAERKRGNVASGNASVP